MAILHRRPEAPFLDRFDRLLIQAHAKTTPYPNVAGRAICLDNYRENAEPLELRLARFLGEFRIDLGEDTGIARPLPAVIGVSSGSAAVARPVSRTYARPDAAVAPTVAHTATLAMAV